MKSRVAQINHGSSYERKESHGSRRRSSSPEDRYAERERSWSPRDRGYSDHSKYDQEYSGKGRDDKTVEARGWGRETPQEKGREKESDRRKQKKFPSPDRKSPERSVPQSSLTHDEPPSKKRKEELDPILTRTGGAYIPPAKLRMMQEQITDKNSLAYQRMSWEALKKSINGLVNKVNVSNIENIIHELLQENIVRGRGLLSRSILQAQSASPIFTHVYAAVVAIINSKFPNIGELILKRLILNFRKGYRRNDKQLCLTASKFVAHLINQNVAHEVLCLEMLTLLLERPTDDSIEVAIGFLKECGLKLTEVSPRGINAIFDRLRHVLHESKIDMRVQYMIEVMFAVRKDGFKDHPIIPEGLDLVEEEDQFTHMLPLEDDYNPEDVLNVFKMDPDFMENEEKYKTLKKEILDEGDSDSEADQDAGSSEEDEEEEEEDEEGQKVTIHDQTEINLVSFRRTIYLAIQSSLDFEECAHKLLKMDFPDSQTKELCNMILDCCAQQRTYEKFFGLLAGRFCMLKKEYMESFEAIFKEQYDTIHRLETNKLRNVAKMFAHLLYTDSLPWSVLECIILSEETTTSSSRIFVKIFFQELSEYMGLPNLNARLKDETLQPFFEGLLPRDNPRNTRFAINFFTSIGLGGLTDELREHLKNAPKMIMTQKQDVESSDSSSSSSESDSSDSNSDSSNSSSGSSSGSDSSSSSGHSSDSDAAKVKRKKMQKKNKARDKVARKKQGSKKKLLEKKIERRQQEDRYDVERNSERNADRNLRDPNRRDDLSKYPYDRDDAADRNSYRSGKDRYHERNTDLENKHGNSKKKKADRRTSFSDNEKDKHCTKDSVHHSRRKERSKSRERNRINSSPREEEEQENRYRNGAEKCPEKYSRYSDQCRESRKNEDRRRENSPRRRK
ncbi:pre-mRNA-splicing factor CWC22 homolog [Mauremys reevesii]|uniref:pre-mRNA-splicing factor CWC22 homolog n=1 Tax=Mauremys reevesii TaxID=260615 RepID=UPI00193EE601|nr:pre-mRNA-splicing factor CWC22 homolog [Mauremys reevesii]XP_039350388.1 pre-mRNA-splicing factor CWC22 homolog [Mauremys reevesii]XP_039350389.1 pre-mRNA-splicing factor CWC22 homolog [Mauremys reevesii]XP_039350390.1 pre-mRNA-splicing factor CWC22 homolog [Mauremys reevesii]